MNMVNPEQPLILIVDDEPLMRLQLSRVMIDEGYQIIEAENGQQCLEIYQARQPNLILLDALMPSMNGFTCCQKIKTLPGGDRTPIIIVTVLDDKESVEKAFDCGASDYITKPIHFTVLRQRIRRFLRQSQLYQQLETVNQELQELVFIDKLTLVANRRRFDQVLIQEWKRMMREQQPLSILLCDIDFFKIYNDTYGHPQGDICLHQVAQGIVNCVQRPADLVARYGGEEFAVILPNTNADGAVYVANKILKQIENLAIEHLYSPVSNWVTLSIGAAAMIPQSNLTPSYLLDLADRTLYQAKKQGRGQLVLNSESNKEQNITESHEDNVEETLLEEWLKMRRAQLPLSLLICELDDFNYYRNQYGKSRTEECLEQILKSIQIVVKRKADRIIEKNISGRFFILLSNTRAEDALYVAKKINRQVENINKEKLDFYLNLSLTISIGIASIIPSLNCSPKMLVDAAEKALQQAKNEGYGQTFVSRE